MLSHFITDQQEHVLCDASSCFSYLKSVWWFSTLQCVWGSLCLFIFVILHFQLPYFRVFKSVLKKNVKCSRIEHTGYLSLNIVCLDWTNKQVQVLLLLCFSFGWFCCCLFTLELFPLFLQFALEFGRVIQRGKLRPGVSFSPGCAGVMVIQREGFPTQKLVGILIHGQVRGLKDKAKTFHVSCSAGSLCFLKTDYFICHFWEWWTTTYIQEQEENTDKDNSNIFQEEKKQNQTTTQAGMCKSLLFCSVKLITSMPKWFFV